MTENLSDIYLFNPTCEYAVANSHPTWQPNLLLQKMEEDLGSLPLFFANQNDVLLMNNLPSEEYTIHLDKVGIRAPRFFRLKDLPTDKAFLMAPKNRLLPWGWSPAAHRLLNPLKQSCSGEFKSSPVADWRPEYRKIYSKKFAADLLKKLLPLIPGEMAIHPDLTPEICKTRGEIEILINRWGKLMVKAPWSSSGRGLQRITKLPVALKVWEKLLGIINDQGYTVVEPYLEKVMDMAFQFKLTKGSVQYLGISRFFTDAKGQYQGNFLNGWPASINHEEVGFAEAAEGILVPLLIKATENSLLSKYYEGSFGIDTLIFSDEQGRIRVNPCLEINVRQSMGLVSLQLEKLLAPGQQGIFKIFFRAGKSFYTFQKEMKADYPLKLQNNRIVSGFYPLTSFTENTMFGAYILAGS